MSATKRFLLVGLLLCVLSLLGCGGASTDTCEGLANRIVEESQEFESATVVEFYKLTLIPEEEQYEDFILLCKGEALFPTGEYDNWLGLFEEVDRNGNRRIGYGELYQHPWHDDKYGVNTDFVVKK